MKYILCLFAATSSIIGGGVAHGQDRARSPYLACADDVARSSYISSDTVPQIQARAAVKCKPFLERNIDLSVATIMKDAAASGKPLPAKAKSDLRGIIRPKLRNAFNLLIQNNVTVLRQGGSK
jgi:hypothetical protein